MNSYYGISVPNCLHVKLFKPKTATVEQSDCAAPCSVFNCCCMNEGDLSTISKPIADLSCLLIGKNIVWVS